MRSSAADSKMKARLIMLCVVLIAIVCISQKGNGDDGTHTAALATVYAIKQVDTEESKYAVCISCPETKNTAALKELLEAADDAGISVCVFMTADFAENNRESAKIIMQSQELGLLITKDLSGMSRTDVMRYMAKCNSVFVECCDAIPKYVKYTGSGETAVYATAHAYGQYAVTGMTDTAQPGSVLDMGVIDASSARILLNTVASCAGRGLVPVRLGDLLYGVGSEVDERGIMYE